MSRGIELLGRDNFPVEKNRDIKLHLEDVKRGNLGVTLSSFEDIYNMSPKGEPFLFGAVNFEDGSTETCNYTGDKITISEEIFAGIERHLLPSEEDKKNRLKYRQDIQQEY